MAQIRKFQSGGSQATPPSVYLKINVEGLGEFDPEAIRTKFAQDPDKWFSLTGADPKHRDSIITRMGEILDMSKEYGLKVDNTGTYTFANPKANEVGINDKYKSTGQFPKKGIFGIGGTKMDDNAINNLAYFTIGKLVRDNSSGSQSNQNDSYMSDVEARLKQAETEQKNDARNTKYKKAYGSIDWDDFIGTGIYSGNTPNLENFKKAYASESERFGRVKGLLQSELDKLEGTDWDENYRWTGKGTKEEYTSNLKNLIDSLSGNVWNNDIYKSAYNLGAADYIQPFLDSSYVAPTPAGSTPSGIVPYNLGDNVTFAEGYDANRIYQAAKERWGDSQVYYDPSKQLLAFDNIGYGDSFTPYLSNYSDIHKGTWYKGYYYKPDETIPGISDAELEQINASRVNDIFDDEIISLEELGDDNYLYNPEFDELPSDIFKRHLATDAKNSPVGLIDMTDLYTTPNGTVFKYTFGDGKKTPYGYVDKNGTVSFGTIKREPGKGVIFTSLKDGKQINLGAVNNKGKYKPFNINYQGKAFDPAYYNAQDPQGTKKNIENGLKLNKHNVINNIYRKMSKTPFTESDRSIKTEQYGNLKFLEYNDELGGGNVVNPSNKNQKLMINPKDLMLYWYDENNKIPFIQVPIKKDGGVIQFLNGGLTDAYNQKIARLKEDRDKLIEETTPIQSGQEYSAWAQTGVNPNKNVNRDKFNSKNLTVGDIFDSEVGLSDTDMLELGSAGADLLSIIAGFIPGAHFVGTGLGVAGTGAQFAADINRDGFDLGDLGSLGMNLGLDAISLIPVVGSTAKLGVKGAKILKHVPKLAKLALLMGLPGAAGTLNKIVTIANDPDRSFSELDMQDIRNLMTVTRGIQYGKNKLSTRQVKGGEGVETRNTVDVIKADGTRAQIELNKTQLDALNNQKRAGEKKSFLQNIINEKAQTDASFTDAAPVVSRFSVNPLKSAPIKGRVDVNTTQVRAGTGEPAYKYNLNSSSGLGRYLARTREYNTRDIFGRKGSPLTESSRNINPENAKAQQDALASKIVESRKLVIDTEKQIADIRSKLEVEANKLGKTANEGTINRLVKEEKLLTDQLSNLNRSLTRDSQSHKDIVLNLRKAATDNGSPATERLSREAQTVIREIRTRNRNTRENLISLKKLDGLITQQERTQNREQQNKQANDFFNQIRQSVIARRYRQTGNMFGNSYNTKPTNNSPFYKEGGKITILQTGGRTGLIKRYPQFGILYNNNYSDYDFQPTTFNEWNNKIYGSAEKDLQNRINFYLNNLPSWVTGNMINNGTANTTGNNVLDFQNRYNQYNTATRDYFLSRGWGTPEDVNAYADAQRFLTPEQKNTARSTDNKLGNYTSTRAAWMNPMVTPELLKQLNDANIFTAQNALANSDLAKLILGDNLYNDVTLNLTPNQGADYVIGVKQPNLPSVATVTPPNTLLLNTPLLNIPNITNPIIPAQVNTDTGKEGTYKQPNDPNQPKKSWDPIPMMRGMEAMLGIIGNNKLEAPTRTPKDPLDLYTFVSGDLQQRSMFLNQANKARRWASQPFTSDASLQQARELDTEMRAADLTAKGYLADSNAIKETGYRAVERQHENARNRNQISNFNRDIFDANNAARTTLKNQKNLANFGILQNVVRDIKNEMIMNRESVRNAEIGYQQEQNSLDYAAEQQRLRSQSSDINSKIDKARNAIGYWNQDISKLGNKEAITKELQNLTSKNDPNNADQIKSLQDKLALINSLESKISNSESGIKGNEDWLYGTSENSYYSRLLDANRNLNTRNMNSIRNVASDNRWANRFSPYGYFGIYKKGGQLTYNEKARLLNAKEKNVSERTLSRNVNKKAISEREDSEKMVREIAKTYREILSKFAHKPTTPRLK